MTSEIRANTLKNRVGLGTVSFTDTGPVVSGIITATTFVGALTGTASGNPTLANGANNRIVTATGANALTGEANLTWTGTYFETSGGAESWTMRAKSGGPESKIGFQNQYLANGYTIGCGAANKSFVVYTDGQSNGERLRIDQTGISTFSQNLFASKDFDVDGHTNLDNVSIAGVTTASGNITISNQAPALVLTDTDNNSDFNIQANGGLLSFNDTTNSATRLQINSSGVVTIPGNLDIDGSTTFGANGTITAGANFVLSSNKLRVSGSDTVGIECQRAGNATIQCTDTTNSTDLQLRANSTGGLVRTATQKPLILGTYQQERLRINSSGNVNIGPSADPRKRLDITGPDGRSGASPGNSDTALIIDNDGGNGAIIEFLSDNNAYGRLFFTDTDGSNRGQIVYEHGNDAFQFSTAGTEKLRIESGGTIRTINGVQSGGNSTGGFKFNSIYSGKGYDIATQYATQANGGSNGNDPMFSGWWGSTNTFRVNTDGKVKYGVSLVHAVQSKGFVLYPNNGGNNKTTIRVSGLVSGCFIFQMGYYNSAGQGEGGFACAVSGYMTTTNQYLITNLHGPYAHANSSISGISKQNSYFEFTITNNHASYTGGGSCGIIGNDEMTITVTYHS